MKYYKSNRIVKQGDSVLIKSSNPNILAKIKIVIFPETKESIEWFAPNGGVVLEFENGDIMSCMTSGPDEDIAFLSRST